MSATLLVLTIVPLVGAIGLLALPLSDEHRGIIALFAMTFSLIGIAVLAAYALEYLLPLWPFALATIVWIPLGCMGIKAIQSTTKKEH